MRLRRAVEVVLQQGDSEEATDGVLGGHIGVARGRDGRRVGVGDEFDLHAVGIGEGEDFFGPVEARSGALDEDAFVAQALLPVVERAAAGR